MKSKLAFSIVLLLVIITPSIVLAQTFIPLVGIPGVDPNNPVLGTYINAVYRLSISLAALLAVIKIVAAGASYMLSDIVTNKSKAKDDIRGALIGLLIVISAVLILTTVNSDLTKTDLLVTPVVLQPPTTPAPTDIDIICGPAGDKCTRITCSNSDGFWWSTYDYVVGAPICATQCLFYGGAWEAVPNITTTGVCVYPNDSEIMMADMKAVIMEEFGSLCTSPLGCYALVCSIQVDSSDCDESCTSNYGGIPITPYRGCIIPNTVESADASTLENVIALVTQNATFGSRPDVLSPSILNVLDVEENDILGFTTIPFSAFLSIVAEDDINDLLTQEILTSMADNLQGKCTTLTGSNVAYNLNAVEDQIEFYCIK